MGWFDTYAIAVVNGLAFGFLLYTISVGLSLILGAMNVLNMAHGVFYLLGAHLAVTIIGDRASWAAVLLAVAVAIVVGVLGGALMSVLTTPLAERGHDKHLSQAMLTLGLAFVGGQLLLMRFGGDVRTVAAPPGLDGSVDLAGHIYPAYRLFLIAAGVVAVLIVTFVMERTLLGALVRATVADAEMTRALGIDTRKVIVGVLALGSALAIVGGVLGAPFLGAYPGLDWRVLMIGLVVVVIGGMGSVRGALVGALIIGQAEVLGTQLAPAFAPFVLMGAMALVLVLRPHGLMGDARFAR